MRKQLFVLLWLTIVLSVHAQKAVIEESLTDVVCDAPSHAIVRYKEVTTILNEQGDHGVGSTDHL